MIRILRKKDLKDAIVEVKIIQEVIKVNSLKLTQNFSSKAKLNAKLKIKMAHKITSLLTANRTLNNKGKIEEIVLTKLTLEGIAPIKLKVTVLIMQIKNQSKKGIKLTKIVPSPKLTQS